MKFKAISLDGPSGAGKTTIVKVLSKILNYKYVDTGAMYRTVAYKTIQLGLSTKIHDDVVKALEQLNYEVLYDESGQVNLLDGINVNNEIRTQKVSQGASDVAVFKEVRMKLVEIQRLIAEKENVIMDGRDIGTYVLPDADYKFYITASIKERAKRRLKELQSKGVDISIEEVEKTIEERDYQDSHRDFAPLTKADDAIEIDTTNLSIDDVIETIKNYIN